MIEFHTHAKVVDEEKRKGGTSKKMPSWDRIFYGNFVINVAGDEFGNVDCGLSLTSTFISALKKILFDASDLEIITFLESVHSIGIRPAGADGRVELSSANYQEKLFKEGSVVSAPVSIIKLTNAVSAEHLRLFRIASDVYSEMSFQAKNISLLKMID